MATLAKTIDGLERLMEQRPELTAGIVEVLPRFSGFLDGMAADGTGTYQYPELYVRLGKIALYADQAPLAEPLFRRSIELDPHLPTAHANLVIAILVQKREAGKEIETAFAEAGDPFWSGVAEHDDPNVLLTMMEDEASAYVDRFPDRATTIQGFTSLIPAERDNQEWEQRGVDGNAFTSASLDYVVSWDDSWTVADATTDPSGGTDLLLISNGVSTLQIGSSATENPEPKSCLDDLIGRVDESEGWKTVKPALGNDGREVRSADADRAYAAFLDQPDDGSAASVYYLECRPLPTSQAFLTFLLIVPANQYESQAKPIQRVMASIRMAGPETTASTPAATPAPIAPAPVSLPELNLEAFTSALVGVDGSTYTSPAHGYSLTVTQPWVINVSVSENGADALELTDGTSHVFLDVFPEGSDTPGACVTTAAEELAAVENVSDVRVWRSQDGTPLRGSEATRAFMALAYHIEAEDAAAMDSTMYVDCRRLADGAMLRILHVGTQDGFDTEAQARDQLLVGLMITEGESDEDATPVSGRQGLSGSSPGQWRDTVGSGGSFAGARTGASPIATFNLYRAPLCVGVPGPSVAEAMTHA
jgi:hypothetical protein